MDQILFYLFSALALGSASYFVFAKNPLYSILSLIVTFFYNCSVIHFTECSVSWDYTNYCLRRSHYGAILICTYDA